MIIWKKQSIKELNKDKDEKRSLEAQISELQDAIIEIADIVAATVPESEVDENG